MKTRVLILALFCVSAVIMLPVSAAAQQVGIVQYAAKVICGTSEGKILDKGTYRTAVNVHNPNDAAVSFSKKFAIAEPGQPGAIIRLEPGKLGPDEALEVDCSEIFRNVYEQTKVKYAFLKGFLVIESLNELDVVAVYTAGGCLRKVSAMDVVKIDKRLRMRALPDLVIESMTHSPPNPTTSDSIIFTATVKNIGSGLAGPSTLALKVGGETIPATFAVPPLPPGDNYPVSRLEILTVAQNYLNTAVADYDHQVIESDETNNKKTHAYTVVP